MKTAIALANKILGYAFLIVVFGPPAIMGLAALDGAAGYANSKLVESGYCSNGIDEVRIFERGKDGKPHFVRIEKRCIPHGKPKTLVAAK